MLEVECSYWFTASGITIENSFEIAPNNGLELPLKTGKQICSNVFCLVWTETGRKYLHRTPWLFPFPIFSRVSFFFIQTPIRSSSINRFDGHWKLPTFFNNVGFYSSFKSYATRILLESPHPLRTRTHGQKGTQICDPLAKKMTLGSWFWLKNLGN